MYLRTAVMCDASRYASSISSPGRGPRKLQACEIVAFSNAELDRYLQERRVQCGITTVKVEDPKNLPESFIQRLRDRANKPLAESALSRAVDLNAVNSRLLKFSAKSGSPFQPNPLSPSKADYVARTTAVATPEEEHDRKEALYFYNQLVFDGGRPAYSIDILEDVSVAALLALYDFVRPFRFHDDPEQQDKSSTWIEYLGFTCSTHYYNTNDVRVSNLHFCVIENKIRLNLAFRSTNTGIAEAQSKLDTAKESLAFQERLDRHISKFSSEIHQYRLAQWKLETSDARLS
ncbi:hypothetical protein GQX73_g6099 [Xylaria multiplex]|uniref:Uncharacterized protein n=1 Tax=Xylaria multiplex TaxID=323545 RepID=A0A7C8IRT9_9PEZI|nr:hypothetical protein GQX73_g6099 [Xylaria multiplex]